MKRIFTKKQILFFKTLSLSLFLSQWIGLKSAQAYYQVYDDVPSDRKITVNLESPEIGSIQSGISNIRGYAFKNNDSSPDANKFITGVYYKFYSQQPVGKHLAPTAVWSGDLAEGQIPYGAPRGDVKSYFGNIIENSGFSMAYAYTNLKEPGSKYIMITVVVSGTYRFSIVKDFNLVKFGTANELFYSNASDYDMSHAYRVKLNDSVWIDYDVKVGAYFHDITYSFSPEAQNIKPIAIVCTSCPGATGSNGPGVGDEWNSGYNAGYDVAKVKFYDEGFLAGKNEGIKIGYDKGYKEGKTDGYNDGFDKGKKQGYNEGYKYGYDDGWIDSLNKYGKYNDGYDDGWEDGYEAGLKESYNLGYNDGYDDGYEDGFYDGYDEGWDDASSRKSMVAISDSQGKQTIEPVQMVLRYLANTIVHASEKHERKNVIISSANAAKIKTVSNKPASAAHSKQGPSEPQFNSPQDRIKYTAYKKCKNMYQTSQPHTPEELEIMKEELSTTIHVKRMSREDRANNYLPSTKN